MIRRQAGDQLLLPGGASAQSVLSARFSRGFGLMSTVTADRRKLLAKAARYKKAHEPHTGGVDDERVSFDLVDGHWD